MTAKPAMTAKSVRDAKPDTTLYEVKDKKTGEIKLAPRSYFLHDDKVRGLKFRMTPKGIGAFTIEYFVKGRRRMMTLGRREELTVEQARTQAAAVLVQARKGVDPLEETETERSAPTVAAGGDWYFAEYAPNRNKPRTLQDYRQQYNRHVKPALGNLKIEDVRRSHVEAMLDRISGPVMRNRVLGFTSSLFRVFGERDWRTTDNPCKRIPKTREHARERVLSVDEQRALMAEIEAVEDGTKRACLKFLMLTGWRCGEALSLEWDWIEFPTADEPDAMTVIRLPDTKTGAQRRTLPPIVAALLVDLPRFANHPRVFHGVRYARLRITFNQICEAAGVEGAHLHDLRRTFATSAAPHYSLTVLRDMLGHKTLAMAGRYARISDTAVEAAQRAEADRRAAILENKPPAKVEKFATG